MFLAKSILLLSLPSVSSAQPHPVPIWSAPPPNASQPLGGFPQVPDVTNRILFYGSPATGNYNHAAMISYHTDFVTVSWKNGLGSNGEDEPGQRVLYTQTLNGADFTPPSILFPSLSSPALPTALFAGPFASLNGHLYASATPAVISSGDAQGSQFCLWPDGLEPRNAGPPLQKQPTGTLLMRRVLDGQGGLGPLFWATTNSTPPGFLPFATLPILTANETDEATQRDIFSPSFTASMPATLPCDDPTGAGGTLKCEAVAGGGQAYQHLTSDPPGVGIANERSHWVIPATHPTWEGGDMMVYRSSTSSSSVLLSAFRPVAPSSWGTTATVTAFPNDQSNINAGALPKEAGGGVFLVLNALPHSERDPLVIATSRDGVNFTAAAAIVSCTHLGPPPLNSPCGGRKGSKEGYGPSYPQGLTVVDPAPAALQGMWVVSTNNKEDVLLSRFPFTALLD